jgi:predicted metal-dependent peptidase
MLLSGETFLDLSLLPGQIIRAHVTYVASVSKFYVHLNPALANRIQSRVDEHVQKPEVRTLLVRLV